MAYNEVNVHFEDLIKLEEKLKLLPNTTEYEINNYLWSNAGKVLEKEVYSRMPVSKYKKYGKSGSKGHARQSESLEIIRYNLGVKIQTKTKPKSKDFGYLVFPDEGRGIKQKEKGRQEFFGKSLDNKANDIAEGLKKHTNKKRRFYNGFWRL